MKPKDIQVTLYPTPAPETAQLLHESEPLKEILQVCDRLLQDEPPVSSYDGAQITAHFQTLSRMLSLSQHLEVVVASDGLEWEALLFDLAMFLPQCAWISCYTASAGPDRVIYYFNFIPLVYHTIGFPFTINLSESLAQQLRCSPEECVPKVCQEVERNIREKGLLHVRTTKNKVKKKQEFTSENQQEPTSFYDVFAQVEYLQRQLLISQEENKRERYAKNRLRIANDQLELTITQLEQTLLEQSLRTLKSITNQLDEEDVERVSWQRLGFDLYSSLLQKAKYLDVMWQFNHSWQRRGRRGVSRKEQEQVTYVKKQLTMSELAYTLEDCQAIESRVKVRLRPWFRAPYVQLLKMDYQSLVRKAAYFDLLQSEAYLLEQQSKDPVKRIREEEKNSK